MNQSETTNKMKLNNNARAIIWEDHILMSKLCDLKGLAPDDFKYHGQQHRLLEDDALQLIVEHTGLSIEELTTQP